LIIGLVVFLSKRGGSKDSEGDNSYSMVTSPVAEPTTNYFDDDDDEEDSAPAPPSDAEDDDDDQPPPPASDPNYDAAPPLENASSALSIYGIDCFQRLVALQTNLSFITKNVAAAPNLDLEDEGTVLIK
jgi:hypothetical protein